MVTVVMRNHQRIDVADVFAELLQPQIGLPAADACIDQQSHFVSLDENAVAAASGLQRDHFHDQQPIAPRLRRQVTGEQ